MNSLKLKDLVLQEIERDIAEGKLYGAAVRVSQNGKTLINENIGVLCDASFRLASMTKPITAVAILLEVEKGRISLEDSVKRYLPAYSEMYIGKVENGKVASDRKAQTDIKLVHLLTHTSGLLSGEMGEQFFPEVNSHRTTLAEAVDYYSKTLLGFEPFTQQSYSPIAAFDVAARIVELVSDMPYDEYIEKNIFAPLEMNDTGFSITLERRAHLAPMHALDASGHPHTVEFRGAIGDFPDTYFCAGGGLVGTADDYAKFADMLLQEGKGVLKPESVMMMRSVHGFGWGLGVRVVKDDGCLPDGCFGWSGAFGTHFWVDPSKDLYAVYMKNSLYDGGSGAQTSRMFEKHVMKGLE